MSVLSAYFDPKVDQRSPVGDDFIRTIKYDDDGNEIIAFEKVDYRSLIESNGSCENWSLKSLLKAGVDPSFPIHTGYNTGMERESVIENAASAIESANFEFSN